MNQNNRPSLREPEILFLSFFGTGFAPKAPGTVGTIATLPFLYGFGLFSPPLFFFMPLLCIFTIISCFIAHSTQQKYQLHDPGWIVIDEVLGMTVAWLFIGSSHWTHLLLMFILFRFFDIIKIWPASYLDKKVEHGAGTILDDVVSGIFAGLCYLLIQRLFIAS